MKPHQEGVCSLMSLPHLVNFFLPLRLKVGFVIQSCNTVKTFFKALSESLEIEFLMKVYGNIDLFLLTYFCLLSRNGKPSDKGGYIIKLCTLSMDYSFMFLSAILSPFLMHLDIVFHFKACM